MNAAQALAEHAMVVLALLAGLSVAMCMALLAVSRLAVRSGMRPSQRAIYAWLIGVAILAVAAVVILARHVMPGSAIADFDDTFAQALDASSTPGLRQVFRVVTLLGTGWALGIASALVAIGLLIRRHFVFAAGWIMAQGGAVGLVKAVKYLVQRARPGLGDTDFYAHGYSFPSGHVVRTFVFCGLLAYLVFRLSRSHGATAIACAVALVWSIVMAFSRLYLGAHYPSDVTAGIILATAWIAVCISAIEAVLRRGSLLPERDARVDA